MRGQGGRFAAVLTSVVALLLLAGCGDKNDAPDVKVAGKKIVKALKLEKAGKDYSLAGNTNCLVERKLLNDSDDVEAARDDPKTKALVVEAKSGGYGVVGVPIFPPTCGEKAVKALAKVKLPK